MSWWEYVERTAQTDRQRDISDKTGIDATNVSRWKSGQVPKPAFVADFARAYGRPVLEAFVAAGFLTEAEAKVRPAGRPNFSQLTNDELLELVRARMSEGGEHGGNTAATSEGERADDDALASPHDMTARWPKAKQAQAMQRIAARRDED